jgi:[NiFe] hydrogenase diaphorase moiety large subunit
VFVKLLDKILHEKGTLQDVQQVESLSRTVGRTSRCGLGQTAPNPILSTLRNFPHLWEARIKKMDYIPAFDLEKSLRTATVVQGRLPMVEDHP